MKLLSQGSLDNLKACIEIANNKGIPLIATHPIYFLNKEDFDSHEIKFLFLQPFVPVQEKFGRLRLNL